MANLTTDIAAAATTPVGAKTPVTTPSTPAVTPSTGNLPVTTPGNPATPVTTPITPVATPPTTTPTSVSGSSSSTSATTTTPLTSASTPGQTSTPQQSTEVVTVTPSIGAGTTEIVTSTSFPTTSSTSSTSSSSSTSSVGIAGQENGVTKNGLSSSGKIAIEVVVPLIVVALLVFGGIFLWRRRKQQKDAEEIRRKEVEEYGYNPNEDPTLPSVAAGGSADGPYEMREDGAGGYRGWGATTLAGSSGRKGSTTLSGGHSNPPVGKAYSDGAPSHGDARSGEQLMGGSSGRPISNGSEIMGAMGPAAGENRGGNMHRGPSNASSSYSVANRSDGSGEVPVPGGAYGAAQYYSSDANYGGPYADGSYGGASGARAEMAGQPVIRDNLARRATRIENPSHFPTQASAGISQNF